ncbi:rho GTPase-activating protein gacF isoform X4 [Aedes aegypti]|uniref:Max-binding protein MNT n=1 Tax=Aedes aegypti TaxID=7159 RepID=A0A6I8TD79_AEDAE|nr:rho GTPase-activating protein gacF isoform X4 [Aedes aegypti]
MYSDNRRSAFNCESGGDKDKCFPYSILSKHQQHQQQQPQLQQHLQHYYPSQQPPAPPGFRNYSTSTSPQVTHSPLSVQGTSFYTNTMVTDVGICFSMSNVNLNSDYPPYLGHPSLSVLGKGYNDSAQSANYVPPSKFRSTSSSYKARNVTPPNGLTMRTSHTPPSSSPYTIPYSPYYFAHPKIPVKIYNNRVAPYLPIPTNSASSASAAAAYGQQLNNYFNYPAVPVVPSELNPASKAPTKLRQNASKTLMNNQYYGICMTQGGKGSPSYSPPSSVPPEQAASPAQSESPINVDGDVPEDHNMDDDMPPLPDDEDDDVDLDEPQDFSLKTLSAQQHRPGRDSDEYSRRTSAPPKKKWIRQHMRDEPLVNGHSTAPPLVVISTNNNASQKHHAVSSLTIDLSTKSSNGSSSTGIIGHRLSSTPPSSGCSSSSSTLTISPVDDSQSSLNLSGGSTSGYITSHSANSSSSLNLSGSSPLPINGSVIATTSHGSNSSPLPHDLVIVQQQQIGHLVQAAGQSHHGLTSTATLLNHIPTGGRRRTTSSNSNGSVGTREVHNKLEKNRRAHLKECFEQLKKQLTLQPDEKKTSNLSILHAAIRYIQVLKRKEREYEHEMERLAKEKIASQNRILVLKREISQWGDVDFSRLAPDTDAIPNSSSSSNAATNSVQSDRDLLNDPPGIAPGRNGIRYSSSSSLSSVATTASIGNLPLQTTISPVLIAASSPSRASPPSSTVNRNSSSPAGGSMPMPLSLTTKGSTGVVSDTHNSTPSPLKFSASSLPNGLNLSTATTNTNGFSNGGNSSGGSNCSTPNSTAGGSIVTNGLNGTPLPLIVNANNLGSLSQSQLLTPVTATILTTGNGTALQTLPLNLNVASSISNGHHLASSSSAPSIVSTSNGMTNATSGLQIIGTTANGTTIPASLISSTTGKELLNGTALTKNGFRTDSGNKIEIIATQSAAGSALDPPATKVIKLVNGNTLVGVTSIDKDKMMLSQVVPQGGLVVSPIQLLTSQGLRVIQQAPNGLATIELSTANAAVKPSSTNHRW